MSMPQREMATDRLVSVIQAIQMGRGTGTLQVRRGTGTMAEEGSIEFVKGQFTQALVKHHKGLEAFNVLSTWGACVFTFTSADPKQQAIFFAVQQAPVQSSPRNEPNVPPTPPFIPSSPLRRSTIPSGQLPPPQAEPPSPAPLRPDMVPRPTMTINTALPLLAAYKLSRTHRQILLLVDGNRPIAEIARMTGRSLGDVYVLLQDLERTTTIWLTS